MKTIISFISLLIIIILPFFFFIYFEEKNNYIYSYILLGELESKILGESSVITSRFLKLSIFYYRSSIDDR